MMNVDELFFSAVLNLGCVDRFQGVREIIGEKLQIYWSETRRCFIAIAFQLCLRAAVLNVGSEDRFQRVRQLGLGGGDYNFIFPNHKLKFRLSLKNECRQQRNL